MDEDQERDSSSDEQGHIIEDEDMEDSPTVCTLEEPDEWWAYQGKIGNSFPLLYEV